MKTTTIKLLLLGTMVASFIAGWFVGEWDIDGPIIEVWQTGDNVNIFMHGMGCGDQRFGPFPLDNLRDEDGSDFVCGDIYMRLRIGGNGIQ